MGKVTKTLILRASGQMGAVGLEPTRAYKAQRILSP